jgi:hypothetical protein
MNLTPIQRTVLSLLINKSNQLISLSDLYHKLSTYGGTGSKFATIVMLTNPRLSKQGKSNFPNASKLTTCQVNLNVNYEKSVNRQRQREGKESDFKSGSSWHKPILINGKHTPFCRSIKTGEVYLRCTLVKTINKLFINNNGEIIPNNAINPFIKETRNTKQDLDKEIRFFCLKLSNVQGLTIGGQTAFIL